MPKTSSKRAVAPQLVTRARTQAEWRRWLERHHASVTSVTLVYARKESGERSVIWDESVDEALCFGWVDGVRGKVDETHFSVRFTPRKKTSIWSKRNLERVARLVTDGLMHPSGLEVFEHGKRAGHHEKAYAIRDTVKSPPELDAALAANRKGRAAFEALTPGQKKAWMRNITWAKLAETRAQRAEDALLLILAGRKAGETDNQAARRGVASKAVILRGRGGR